MASWPSLVTSARAASWSSEVAAILDRVSAGAACVGSSVYQLKSGMGGVGSKRRAVAGAEWVMGSRDFSGGGRRTTQLVGS